MPTESIDWGAAVRTGQRLAPRGPDVTADQARQAVSDLRRYSKSAELAVRETTGMGAGLPVADAEVVDRRGWVAATAEGMETLTAPLVDRLPAMHSGQRVAGSQIGVLLGYLSGKVLGQYDPVGAAGSESGRLLLVAPNVIKIEREIDADPADFRLWVCLHEGTHRLQFTAVPWLAGYFRSLIDDYAAVAPTDASELLRRAVGVIRGGRGDGPRDTADGASESWIQRVQTPEQRRVFDALMALMTLLEGHADHIMDAVGPAVVPSVATIRSAFSQRRRKGRGPLDRLVRTLLGMDMKLAQYVRGAAFTRRVIGRVGMDGFNAVWTSRETLPTLAEIADPVAWVRRVHG